VVGELVQQILLATLLGAQWDHKLPQKAVVC